jgi:capsular polysaccharide biosynthesis protein
MKQQSGISINSAITRRLASRQSNPITYLFFSLWLLASLSQPLIYADTWHCDIISLSQIIENNNQIKYIPCYPARTFTHKELPLATNHWLHPYTGLFKETFILNIPQGLVTGLDGWIIVDDCLIQELIWQNVYLHKDGLHTAKQNHPVTKKGRVAVIAQTGHSYYYHWMVEVLGRLALLELQNIEYDYLYVPMNAPYMKETLQLWGIDPSKIIPASDDYIVIADELIVPSLVSSVVVHGLPRLVHYIPDYLVQYIRNKLLRALEKKDLTTQFNKKVFISRQDATARKIINEDEVFALFEAQGFTRYHLTKLSILEQILLFKNAETIVGSLGSGLTNIIFCNPYVQIIELYQARRDSTIWNLSQMVGLANHQCIKTTEFIEHREGQLDTEIPLEVIHKVIELFLI